MAQKRQPEDEDGDRVSSDGSATPEEKRLKVPSFKQVVKEAVRKHNLQKFISALEPLVRRVVKEEVESALTNHLANMTRECGEDTYSSTSRNLQLKFKNRLSLPIFTGTKIEGENFSVLNIALIDGLTGQVVKSGIESSMKVEIVVLEGDFEGGEEENWTMQEFKNNIVREREGKRSLLNGDVSLDLSEGIGLVGELSFTDNSSWTRSRKFRLGAMVSDGYFHGTRVREARSEPFMVKDHRGELYKKHYPPALGDEVWRLEKIGKDGVFHKRLRSENISTVKDFLTLLCMDAPRLRNILGSGMSAKMWDITVEHARTCVLTNQLFAYTPNGQSKNGVIFNVVGEVTGLLTEQQFVSVNDLSDKEKVDAQSLAQLAFDHSDDVFPYEMGAVIAKSSHAPVLPVSQVSHDNMHSNYSSLIKADGFGYTHSSVSSPDMLSIGSMRGFEGFSLHAMNNPESGTLSFDSSNVPRNPERMSNPNPLIFDECGSHSLFDEDTLQYLDSDIAFLSQSFGSDSQADLGTAVAGFLATSARSAAAREKANTGWATLVSLLRWRFSIKRIVASKRHRIHGRRR